MIKEIFSALFLLLLISCTKQSEIIKLETASLTLSIDAEGNLNHLIDKINNLDYLAKETNAALLSIRIGKDIFPPVSAVVSNENKILIFKYSNGIEVKIKYDTDEDYIKFDLVWVSDNKNIDLIIWGPYPTTLNKVIGETIGVVQGESFALGIQSLNTKTLGGFPWTDNDCMPEINIFAQNNYSDLSEVGKENVLYRVEAAKPTEYGSSLQTYCRNRNKERIINNLSHDFYLSPIYDDGGIIGSSIALFGCLKNKILPTIEQIELKENLPHPLIEGEWGKISKESTRAYLIYDFSENNINDAIKLTKKAGLKYLYHSNPFETWGKFNLNKNYFPNGVTGLKKCVDLAQEQGISVGIHTLSNFISTNDKYVTPIPDKRLGKVGSSVIIGNINSTDKIISIKDPLFFNQFRNNNLKTVQIENELIRYGNVIEKNGWQLIDCERGAFGTKMSEHLNGSEIYVLADHGYKVFLTNPELSLEVSKNIADLFNTTGLRQISFDGLEGNRSTGMGNYGEILFTSNWYKNLNENIKKSFIADASRTSHFFWHIFTRMNWGEPWYAGFRESQTEYRLKNQEYFKRNLIPGMLGWFQLRAETSIEDIEWMLARSAAYNAGYALVVNNEALIKNQHSEEMLDLIKQWEKARLSGSFNEKQKKSMQDVNKEFNLKTIAEEKWELTEVYSNKFIHEKKILQPGEPVNSTFNFSNPTTNENFNFIIKAIKSDLSDIIIELDNYKRIQIPITLTQNEIMKYNGGNKIIVYNSNWKKINEIPINEMEWKLNKGNHQINFDCKFSGGNESQAKLEIRLFGDSEKVSPN